MELFKLLGTIAIDSSGAVDAVDKISEKTTKFAEGLEKTGQKISAFGTSMTAKLSVPIIGLGTLAVKSAAEVKAANSQFEQTFGDLQSQADSAMKGVAESSGILQTRLQGIGTSIYAFAKASGADSAEALALMETALQATADGAAYYDRSLEDTAESLQSFLKGNFENDAALGLSCTETTRNAAAMELFGQKFINLSEIQKQQTLLKMVTDAQKLSGAMGQASRESDGLENVTGNLMESLKQCGAELGEVLLPTVIKVVQKATEMIKAFSNMDDRTKKLIITIGGIAIAVGPVLTVLGKGITVVGQVIAIGSKLFGGIGSIISIGTKLFSGIGTVASFVTGTLIPAIGAINPVVLVVIGVITALIAAGVALYKNWDEVSAFGKKCWDGICDFISEAVDNIVGFFEKIVSFISDNWQALLMLLVNPFVGGFKLLYDNCEEFRVFIDEFFGKIGELFSNTVKNINDKAKELKENFVSKFEEMKEEASAKMEEMRESITSKAKEIKEKATEHFNELKDKWSKGFGEARDAIIEIATDLKEKASSKITELKDGAAEKISAFASTAVSKFGEVRDRGSEAIQNLKETASAKFVEMGNAVAEKFSTVSNTIMSVFNNAKDAVANIVENIKGFFNFEWKLPDIKLPHFNIDWEKTGAIAGLFQKIGLEGIPKIGVEWYAKGAVLNDPTVFGMNGNNLMVGGEAGAEAVAPIETLKAYVREAVEDSNNKVYDVLLNILSLLTQYMPELANMQLVMDSGAVVGELAEPMNVELGRIAQMRGRRN